MKLNILTVVALLSGCLLSQAVEYGYLSFKNNGSPGDDEVITLNAGDWIEFGNSNADFIKLTLPDSDAALFDLNDPIGRYLVGPCELQMIGNANGVTFYASYKITRASEVEYKQANIVSLPIDTVGAGTHEIVVEASDDLQTWTPVHSSSIGGNRAFFRTRVVRCD